MKKITTFISALLAGIMIFSFAGCGNSTGTKDKVGEAKTFVSLDINPQIELTVDGNNKVVSVHASNEDGRVLLHGEASFEGESLENAIDKITNLAVELGYLSEDNKVVQTSIVTVDETKKQDLEKKINDKIKEVATKVGFDISAEAKGSFSYGRKFNEFKAKYPDNQLIQALTMDEFKLALKASETGEVSLEVAVTMDKDEIIKLLSTAHNEIENFATNAYNKAKAEAFRIYDKAVGALLDNVYSNYYFENMRSHVTTFWYGHAYETYKTMARSFDGIARIISCVEKVSEYAIDEQTAIDVLTALNLDASEIEKIKNSDGKITIESIEAYVDKLVKNAGESEEIETIKTEITAILSEIDQTVGSQIVAEIEKLEPQIESIVSSIETIISTVKTSTAIIPESAKVELNAFIADIEGTVASIVEDIRNKEISSAKLNEYAKEAEQKAINFLSKIEEDLSEEEFANLQSRIADLSKTLDGAKQTMEDAIERAEKSVCEKIENAKKERKERHGKK